MEYPKTKHLIQEWQSMSTYHKDKDIAAAIGLDVVEDESESRDYLYITANGLADFCPEFSDSLQDVRQAEDAAISANVFDYMRYLSIACGVEYKERHDVTDMIPMITATADQRAFAVWATLTQLQC